MELCWAGLKLKNTRAMKNIIYTLAFLAFISMTNAQWQPDVRLTNAPGHSYTSYNNAWCVAANGNILHAVWNDNRDGNTEIYYKRSTDAGLTWGADTRLTNDTNWSEYPSIAVSGSLVHIVWSDIRNGFPNDEIYYKRSTDGGVTWGTDTRLTNATSSSMFPSVAVTGSVVHVVWMDGRDGNDEIYYKYSSDAGVSWGSDTRLTNNTANSDYPSIAVSGSLISVVWEDTRNGNDEIYYKRSTDGGVTWGADTRLTSNSADSWYPSVAESGTVVYVVWLDRRDGNNEIYYKCSTDGGMNWEPDTRLTNNTANSYLPSIAVSGSLVHVVWEDYRDDDSEIYYKCSTDGGLTWGADTRLTNYTGLSKYSSIAVSGSLVHVVWEDTRDGNYEIYYKRNPTGNVTNIHNISTEIPSAFSLSQNYPNPFNPVTKIRFDVPQVRNGHDRSLQVIIYDMLGRLVATLVNESLKPGTYEVDWDGSDYSSGVYFCRLKAGDFSDWKKMILIK